MQENTMSYYGKPLGWIGNFKDEDGKKFASFAEFVGSSLKNSPRA